MRRVICADWNVSKGRERNRRLWPWSRWERMPWLRPYGGRGEGEKPMDGQRDVQDVISTGVVMCWSKG